MAILIMMSPLGEMITHVLQMQRLTKEWSMQFNTPLLVNCYTHTMVHVGVISKMQCLRI